MWVCDSAAGRGFLRKREEWRALKEDEELAFCCKNREWVEKALAYFSVFWAVFEWREKKTGVACLERKDKRII